MSPRRRWPLALPLLALFGCGEGAEGSVLFEYERYANPDVLGLEGVAAALTIVDGTGAHATANVEIETGEPPVRVQSPIPMECGGGTCLLTFSIAPGSYQLALDVTATDRCGGRAVVLTATPAENPVALSGAVNLSLDQLSFAYDDDDDGIENVLEPFVCGRFDVDDGDRPPRECRGDHPCCAAAASDLVGRRAAFDGGPHTRADGTSVEVAPFSLDATEVTFASFARCVAAGACLFGQPDHPVRVALETAAPTLPVTGLVPSEAQAYCAWRGRRLPRDDEWDFAAAHDDDGGRARFPFAPDASELVLGNAPGGGARDDAAGAPGCVSSVIDRPSFNHRATGVACPGEPVAVASYPTSHNWRGRGAPIADLAGNVYEWTVDALVTAPGSSDDVVPPGVGAVFARGGYYLSPLALVENDFAIRVALTGDRDAAKSSIRALADVTGFRCATDGDTSLVSPEPLCPVVDAPDDAPSGEDDGEAR